MLEPRIGAPFLILDKKVYKQTFEGENMPQEEEGMCPVPFGEGLYSETPFSAAFVMSIQELQKMCLVNCVNRGLQGPLLFLCPVPHSVCEIRPLKHSNKSDSYCPILHMINYCDTMVQPLGSASESLLEEKSLLFFKSVLSSEQGSFSLGKQNPAA